MFTDRYKGLRAQFKPKLKGSIEHILEGFLQELYEPETKALKGLFLVLDMDTLYTQGKIPIYEQIKKKLEAVGDSNLSIIESRPCIEYWFLLHFVFQDKLFVNCDSVLKELKKRIVYQIMISMASTRRICMKSSKTTLMQLYVIRSTS